MTPRPVEPRPDPAPSSPSRGLLQIAWERRWAVALGLLCGAAAGAAYYLLTPPVYTSSAQLLVVRKAPETVTGGDGRSGAAEDYVSTHQAILKSPLVIDRAIKLGGLVSLPSLAHARDATEAVLQRLTIVRARDPAGASNNILTLTFRGAGPDECHRVLDALIRSYRQVVAETYGNVSEDTVTLIARARDDLHKELARKEAAYRAFRRTAPLIWKGKDGINPRQERLEKIEAERTVLVLRQAAVKGKLVALEKAIAANHSRDVLLGLAAEIAGKASAERAATVPSAAVRDQLFALLAQEAKLLERLGPNHPEVKSVREQIATARAFLARPSAVWGEPRDAAERPFDPVQLALQSLRQELEQIEASARLLASVHDREQQEARRLGGDEVQDELFRKDIARTQALYDTIVKRLQDASLVKDFGGYDARAIAAPGSGGVRQVEPSKLIAAALAVLVGVLAGCGLAYLAEATDRRFRSVEDIGKRLGAPVLGQIPRLRAERVGRGGAGLPEPLLCTFHRPTSTAAEAYRGLRTALCFRVRGGGPRVIQVTSPAAGDGKTTLAANLAISLAQSGKRVVLVDADLRAPRLHRAFGVDAGPGLAAVIDGAADLGDALRTTAVPGLRLLPGGTPPSNPAELLTSTAFEDLLAELKDDNDFVLLDSPAVLGVTDARAVAGVADGVLLVLRGPRGDRVQAARAGEALESVGAHLLGVALNGGKGSGHVNQPAPPPSRPERRNGIPLAGHPLSGVRNG
ncbi:MAG: polysaccharide biosynthesis tyrosine autokinase [Gemmataceae bacterium]|nr:polysaccharide biosynthesis tyrosine autokinase [Gemmataceae bacterium]